MYEYEGGSRGDDREHDADCACRDCATEDAGMRREMELARAGLDGDGMLTYREVA